MNYRSVGYRGSNRECMPTRDHQDGRRAFRRLQRPCTGRTGGHHDPPRPGKAAAGPDDYRNRGRASG